MYKYRQVTLMFVTFFFVTACMTTDDIFGRKTFENISLVELLLSEKSPILSPETEPKTDPVKIESGIVSALLEVPSVARSIAAAFAAEAQVSVTETQKSSKIDITGSTGLNADPWPLSGNAVQGAATASISARQLLSDNGQTDRFILLTKLASQRAFLEAEVVIDQNLKALIEAHDVNVTSTETIKIIDHYLGLYNAREELVLSAVQAGVLSKSDELELRSLRNNTVSDRTSAALASNRAESFLKSILKKHYQAARLELVGVHDSSKSPSFLLKNSPKKELLDLRFSQLNLEIEIQRSRNKPTSNWQTSLSSPTSRGGNTTLFGGVTIGFPVADGGEAAAEIDALTKQLAVAELDLEVLIQEINIAEENWSEFLKYYLLQKTLLKERIEISNQSIEELELRLKAGRSDVSKLAREILSKAQAEIALVQLEARYLSERVKGASASGETCNLFSLCEKIRDNVSKN